MWINRGPLWNIKLFCSLWFNFPMICLQLTSQTWACHCLGTEWVYFLMMVAEPILSTVLRTLYLENFKSMPVPFVWIALQGKASSCLVRGSHIHTAEHWSHLPLGANAVPLCHETHFGFVVFKSPVYIIRRDLCCQLPEWHFYSMKSCLCALHGTRCLKAWGLLGWFEIK